MAVSMGSLSLIDVGAEILSSFQLFCSQASLSFVLPWHCQGSPSCLDTGLTSGAGAKHTSQMERRSVRGRAKLGGGSASWLLQPSLWSWVY